MEKIKVLDENDNVILLDRISVNGQCYITSAEESSLSIDSISCAKQRIAQKIVEEMENHLFFTKKTLYDGSILIECKTFFYGKLNNK